MNEPATSLPEPGPQWVRIAEKNRPRVEFTLDGQTVTALEGDTVMTAVLTQRRSLRRNEFSAELRAGFCVMGACQDCWVATEDGHTVRSCSTAIVAGMRLLSGAKVCRP